MILTRFAYLSTCTLGWLEHEGHRWATIERPWVPDDEDRGGKNGISCVPDGTYQLHHHSGPRFSNVFALASDELDVNLVPINSERVGVLIHQANKASELQGCIAVGEYHGTLEGQHAVMRSAMAMSRLRLVLVGDLPKMTIRPTAGTSSGRPYA